MLAVLRWPERRSWSSKTSVLAAFWSVTLTPQRLATREMMVSLPSVGWTKEPAMAAAPMAVQVMTPVEVLTALKVTVCVATVPAAAGGPVSLKAPAAPMRRTISVATAGATGGEVGAPAAAAGGAAVRLGADVA